MKKKKRIVKEQMNKFTDDQTRAFDAEDQTQRKAKTTASRRAVGKGIPRWRRAYKDIRGQVYEVPDAAPSGEVRINPL